MSENTVGEKTVDELIADIRAQLVNLRGSPIPGITAAGRAIEWKLRDLERGIRAIQAKYDYARDAATGRRRRSLRWPTRRGRRR